MKLLFLTNIPSYHQVELANSLVKLLGEDSFRLVFHRPTSDYRTNMGWKDLYKEPYILRYWQSGAEEQQIHQWIEEADVVVQGRFPIKHLRNRISAGKLTFAYQERIWKRQPSFVRTLRRLPFLIKNYASANKANYHFLSAGKYAAQDLNKLGFFLNRSWKFGYFINSADHLPREQHDNTINMVWCGRFCGFKQPSKAIEILAKLRQSGMNINLTMIGDGELKPQVLSEIDRYNIKPYVELTGWQTQEETLQHMQNADLFISSSDRGEGWGVVVNEAMNNGCAVVANQELGAAPWLVKHGKTGFLYQDSDIEQLVAQLAQKSRSEILDMGKNAHQYHEQVWSSKVAAQRLIKLSQSLIKHDLEAAQQHYQDGPCSAITHK